MRENVSGLYQGEWKESPPGEGADRRAQHSFFYTEKEVDRILIVAEQIAMHRRGEMTVVIKDGGIPAISKLWRDRTTEIASKIEVKFFFANIDYEAYHFIQHPQELDVVVALNIDMPTT